MRERLQNFWESNKVFIGLLVFIILFRVSVADQYHVPSGSMEPTIAIGDRILVNKLSYHVKLPFTNLVVMTLGEPKRGDIIVFEKPGDHTVMVKRLVGLPGDYLEVKNGFIRVNGDHFFVEGQEPRKALREARLEGHALHYHEKMSGYTHTVQRLPLTSQFNEIRLKVPQDQYFFMGDNRDNSNDSRAWQTVSRQLLKGRASRVLYSMIFSGFIPKFNWSRTGRNLYQVAEEE